MSVDEKDVLLMSLTGSVSQYIQEDVMAQGSALSRGDKRRNARLARVRELVSTRNAVVGIDLADEKQVLVVTDHDSRVLARRRVRAKAWQLGPVLKWARQVAREHGFADVTVHPSRTAWPPYDPGAPTPQSQAADEPATMFSTTSLTTASKQSVWPPLASPSSSPRHQVSQRITRLPLNNTNPLREVGKPFGDRWCFVGRNRARHRHRPPAPNPLVTRACCGATP